MYRFRAYGGRPTAAARNAAATLLRLSAVGPEREFVIDNLLVRNHFIIVMMRWTSLAPWGFEFPFPGSLR